MCSGSFKIRYLFGIEKIKTLISRDLQQFEVMSNSRFMC